jgi:hypothetical protein
VQKTTILEPELAGCEIEDFECVGGVQRPNGMACWREAQLAWVLTIVMHFFLPVHAFAPAQGPFWQVAHKRGGTWPGADVGAAEQRNALPGSRWIAPKLPTQKREYRAGDPTVPRSAGGPRGSGPGARQMFRTGVQAIFKWRAIIVLYLLVLTSVFFPLPSRATPSGRAVQLQEHVAAPHTNVEVSLRRGIGHPRVAFVTSQDAVKTISEPVIFPDPARGKIPGPGPQSHRLFSSHLFDDDKCLQQAFVKDPTLDEMNGPFQGLFTSTGFASKVRPSKNQTIMKDFSATLRCDI